MLQKMHNRKHAYYYQAEDEAPSEIESCDEWRDRDPD